MKPSAKISDPIIVIGMARSGTSLMAGMLRILGVHMGPDTVGAGWNPKGSIEDLDFQILNRRMIERAGGVFYHQPIRREQVKNVIPAFHAEVQNLLEKKQQVGAWGWKDPFTLLTLDAYLPFFDQPKIVCIFRNVYDVARSIERRQRDISWQQALSVAHHYHGEVISLLKEHATLPTYLTSFERVRQDPEAVFEALAAFLGVEVTQQHRQALNAFIVPKEQIESMSKRLALKAIFMVRLPRLLKKCWRNPKRTPAYIKEVVKNNLL